MRELRVMSLGSEDRILNNVCDYILNKSEKREANLLEVIDYINEHADHEDDTPAVYVGTYGKYNGGDLFGLWVNLASFDDYDEFIEYCKAIHSDEEDPEFMFQDYQGFPYSWYSESGLREAFDKILEYAECDNQEAADIWLDDLGHEDLDGMEDAYNGEWDSEEDFASHIFEECYEQEMSEFARRYFDVKQFARDLFIDDYYFSNGHVFSRY